VINAAIVGMGLKSMLTLWRHWVAQFRPAIVIVYPSPGFYLSIEPGPSRAGAPHESRDPNPPWWTPRLAQRSTYQALSYPPFIQRRRVARALAAARAGHDSSWYFRGVPTDRLGHFLADLDSLVTGILEQGSTPVLMTHAMRFTIPPDPRDADLLNSWQEFTPQATGDVMLAFEQAAAQGTRELGSRRGIAVVDVAAAMSGHREWFGDFTHFTDQGSAVVAGLIAQTLRHGVLGSSSMPFGRTFGAIQ
jgi:hypothetical protein